MITMSDAAAARLKALLEQAGKPRGGARISLRKPAHGQEDEEDQETRCHFDLVDAPQSSDWTREIQGVRVFVDPAAADDLEGAELDVVGGELTLRLAEGAPAGKG